MRLDAHEVSGRIEPMDRVAPRLYRTNADAFCGPAGRHLGRLLSWRRRPFPGLAASATPSTKLSAQDATPPRRGVSFAVTVLSLATLCAVMLTLVSCTQRRAAEQPASPGGAQTIENRGSDTLVNLALAWAEAYMHQHPKVRVSVTGGGSGTGIAALINGTVDIANASRQMSTEEFDSAKANGISPVEHTVARDAIAVVVNPVNPVGHLTLQQISDIYVGKTRDWREVGGKPGPIVLLSRESNSGTYMYLLENVIRMGKKGSSLLFSPDTLLMPSSEGISSEIRQNPNAIGYDGLGYVTPDQKAVAVGRDARGPFVLPSVATVNDGSYPISRPLFMYAGSQSSSAVRAYLDWVVDGGQAIVPALGFVPLQ